MTVRFKELYFSEIIDHDNHNAALNGNVRRLKVVVSTDV